MTEQKKLSQKRLRALAMAQGLSLASVTGLAPLQTSVKPLNDWQQSGYAGSMAYMLRPSELLCEPLKLFPQGRSAVSFAVLYDQSAVPEREAGYGKVARYAWGNDYHAVLRERLTALVAALEGEFGEGVSYRVFSDAVPLLERALAERAGLGFVGKNSLLIRPGTGSLFFLAEILWDIEVEADPLAIVSGTCGTCRRCMEGCPTKAIVAERVIDARRCISYLTIEKRGSFDPWERRALGEWVFGCDVCQEVCPFNYASLKEQRAPALGEFKADRGAGPVLNLSELLAIRDDESFRKRFAKSPLLRPKRAGMLRNAACVAANTLAEQCLPLLIEAARDDAEAVVREHSVWALTQLKVAGIETQAAEKVVAACTRDGNLAVRSEAFMYLESRKS